MVGINRRVHLDVPTVVKDEKGGLEKLLSNFCKKVTEVSVLLKVILI